MWSLRFSLKLLAKNQQIRHSENTKRSLEHLAFSDLPSVSTLGPYIRGKIRRV